MKYMKSRRSSARLVVRAFFSALSIATVLALTMTLAASLLVSPVLAIGPPGSVTRLDDGAALLSPSQKSDLSAELDRVSNELGFDIVFVSTNTIGRKTPSQYADDYYDQHGYGVDGILMLVNMGERDIAFSTAGKCIRIFTDYGIDYLIDDVGDYLTDGDYGDAVERFIERCRLFTEEYESGAAFDVDNKLPLRAGQIAVRAGISLAVGLVVGLIAVETMRSKLRTVRTQPAASAYIRAQSLAITEARDVFLYSNIVRTERPKANSSSGGGGSRTHTSSGGVSHGGRSGKF